LIADDLDSPRKVKEIFEKLIEWLDKKEITVFFFIDDLDRASGEQIRDILSELKVYVSNRRIVAILGYDENYVFNAIQSFLPEKIDSRKYLEKIVTITTKLPQPDFGDLRAFAEMCIKNFLPEMSDQNLANLGRIISQLSNNNPRRLKSLILGVTNLVTANSIDIADEEMLLSIAIITDALKMGLLDEDNLRRAFNEGDEDRIISLLEQVKTEQPEKEKEIAKLIVEIEQIQPNFTSNIVNRLRLHPRSFVREKEGEGCLEELTLFNWVKKIFFPLLKANASRGFELGPEEVLGGKITIPSSSSVEFSSCLKLYSLPQVRRSRIIHNAPCYKITTDSENVVVLLSSSFYKSIPIQPSTNRQRIRIQEPNRTTRMIIEDCPIFVEKKPFILWIVDDLGLVNKQMQEILTEKAARFSPGLKNPFSVAITDFERVEKLSSFLFENALKE